MGKGVRRCCRRLEKAFEPIGFAKVSGSAHEAVELGYLRRGTPIVMSRARSEQEVLALAEGYRVVTSVEPSVSKYPAELQPNHGTTT